MTIKRLRETFCAYRKAGFLFLVPALIILVAFNIIATSHYLTLLGFLVSGLLTGIVLAAIFDIIRTPSMKRFLYSSPHKMVFEREIFSPTVATKKAIKAVEITQKNGFDHLLVIDDQQTIIYFTHEEDLMTVRLTL